MSKKRWSYSTGGWGRNRVRAYCEGCPGRSSCRSAREHTGPLFLERYEPGPDGKLVRRRTRLQGVTSTTEAATRADMLAAELAKLGGRLEEAPKTIDELIAAYLEEVTPTKGKSKQDHDRRAARLWRAFFDAQPEPSRHCGRPANSLDRIDWGRFIRWRRQGLIPGFERRAKDRQVQYDLAFLMAVLNWAVGAGYIPQSPWSAQVRRTQGWESPRELNPNRPAMTDEIRSKLIEHSPHWQFSLALVIGRYTASRNSSVRHLRWSDIDLEAGTIRWRGEYDKTGQDIVVPIDNEAVAALRSAPSRGIGEAWVFPAETDPSKPTSRNMFQVWLRRAKERYLRSIADPAERELIAKQLKGLGFHGEKRAAVRDPVFRALPPKVQEAIARTNYETLRRVYDAVTVDEVREAIELARKRVLGS